ncbi:MAG TPA: N-6 DNA methylase [Sulfolobales archaeon]|nr:N-6 DNA methylase [Sulfolobales archaeon]
MSGEGDARYTAILDGVGNLIDIAERSGIAGTYSYKFYSSILSGIYRGLSDRELFTLFSIHTAIQIYINTLVAIALGKGDDPLEICSGDASRDYLAPVPQLLWWRDLVERENKKILKTCLEVISYTRSLNKRDLLEIDLVSKLYEDLISRMLRYRSGEYYTPRWITELVIERLKAMGARLAGELIIDPSCGSGRFLVSILRRKIAEGVDPAHAYYETLGFDINPLAVAMTRARLLVIYNLLVGREPPGVPAILWGDFISYSLSNSYLGISSDLYKALLNIVTKNLMRGMDLGEGKIYATKRIINIYSSIIDLLDNLRKEISKNNSKIPCKSANPIVTMMCNEIRKSISQELHDELIRFIEGHEESLGILFLSSAILGGVLKALNMPKPGIAITNPPWLEINELPRNEWGKAVRKYVKSEYGGKYGLPRQAVQKGDLSTVFLDLMLGFVRDRGYVGIVLPAGQSYSGSTTPHGAGKLLTYAVLEKWGCEGEILYLGDVFRHGVHASIAIVRRGGVFE